jgi:chromosome segregation ATPase
LAFTGIAVQHDGWHSQAEHLALTHKAVGLAAVMVADQARQRPSLLGSKKSRTSGRRVSARREPPEQQAEADSSAVVALPPDTDQAPKGVADTAPRRQAGAARNVPAPHVELAAVKNLLARKTAVVALLDERVRKLAAETAAKDSRLAEFEQSIAALREDVAHRENENRSLLASLDLANGENKRLANSLSKTAVEAATLRAELADARASLAATRAERDRLAAAARDADELHITEFLRFSESAAETERLRAELAQTKARLGAMQAERDGLALTLDGARDVHRRGTQSLESRLDAMTSRAAAAESLLGDIQRYLLARVEATTDKDGTGAGPARNAASEALDLLEAKINEVQKSEQEREQSRAALKAATGSLLNLIETRLAALVEAQNTIGQLQRQLGRAQAAAAVRQSEIDSLSATLQSERKYRAALEARLKEAPSDHAARRQITEPNEMKVRNAASLLASTISF